MNTRSLLLIPLLAMAAGCITHSQTYNVSVQNRLDKPVTLWIVKDDGPEQLGWLSPEQVAENNQSTDDEQLPDVVLQPNQTAKLGPLAGSFYKDNIRASLRIYGGSPTLTQMLATGRGGLNRCDLNLEPGPNFVVIQEKANGGIGAKRTVTPPPPPPPPPEAPAAPPAQ
jgi:hypothetical protein